MSLTVWHRVRAALRAKHEVPWRADILEWLNVDLARLREHNVRRRTQRDGGVS